MKGKIPSSSRKRKFEGKRRINCTEGGSQGGASEKRRKGRERFSQISIFKSEGSTPNREGVAQRPGRFLRRTLSIILGKKKKKKLY